MSAVSTRILEDIEKIRKLSVKTNNRISINRTDGEPPNVVFIDFKYNTVPDSSFPTNKLRLSTVRIDLSNRYPFQEPTAKFVTPIFHPNVFEGGKICLGKKWLPTDTLDLLAERIAKIIIFEPDILDTSDAANAKSKDWYVRLKAKNPNLFPTDNFSSSLNKKESTIKWNNKI